MAQTYTRQSSFANGDTVTAALFNNEYNQLVNAFAYSSSSASSTGHRHDGTAGQGGNIHTIGDLDFLNKIVVDDSNNRWGVFVEVSSAAVEQIRIQDGAIVPVTDSDIDLGTTGVRFKDAYIDSVTTTGNVAVGGNLTVTGTTTFNGGTITMGDAATDNVVFGADVDSNIIPDDDDSYDLGSSSQEWRNLFIDGTANIDSLVADTADINGGTVDGAIIGGSSAAAITGTTITGTSFVIGSADINEAELETIDGVTAGTVAASKAIVVDSNKDFTGARNITLTGELDAGSLDVSGDVDVDGTTNLDVVDIDGAVDMATTLAVAGNVDFNGDLDVDGTTNLDVVDIDGAVDMATTLAVAGNVDFNGDLDVDGTTNLDVVDIDGAVDMATTLTVGGEVTAASLDISGNVDIDGTLETDALSLNGTAVTATAADINLIDGITNGTVIASKAIITDSNKDITGGRNITISGELDAGSLDISGDADIDGTLEADAITIGGITLAETISDTVGAMVSSNTETNITVTYQDSDNTLDFAFSGSADTTGNAATATALETARTIHGVSFDGTANIDLSEVVQDTVGAMFSSNTETNITATYQDSDGTIDLVIGTLNQDTTGLAGTATALATARTIHGVSFDGTANIDLTEVVQDTVGAMFSSNTESGITVAYEDSDGTIDLTVGTLNQNTTGSAATLTTARTIGGVSFDGSANIVPTTFAAATFSDDVNIDSGLLFADVSANRVGINQASPDVSLDLGANTDAVHMPTGNTAQRPGSPAAGYFRYNSETAKFEGYTSEWGSIAGGGSGTNMDTNIFAGDGSDTTFTLSTAPDTEQNLMVFIDGVFQAHDSYSVSGTTLTFSTAPANGRVITAYHSTTTVGGSNNTINTMTGDNSDTTLTLSVAPVHENNVQVYFDGVYQSKSNYAISGTTLTFSTAPPTGVLVEAITNTNTSSTTANQLLDADGDTKIQVEESSDEDTIRFDIAGAEDFTMTANTLNVLTGSNVIFADSAKANFGAGSDLQIYHTGSNSFVDDTGTGDLYIRGSNNIYFDDADSTHRYAQFISGGAVKLRYDNSAKFETTSTGVDVTGTITSDGLTTSGNIELQSYSGTPTTGMVLNSNNFVYLRGGSNGLIMGKAGDNEAMRIDTSGNVGIGSTSPTFGTGSGLEIQKAGPATLRLEDTGSGGKAFEIFADDGTGYQIAGLGSGMPMIFSTVSTERMRINSSGQLLLGTTSNNSDSYKMIVDLGGGAKGIDVRGVSYNADNGAFRSVPTGNTSYRFAVMLNSSNSTVGKIEVTSANTTYTTSSDYRLKENVTPLENGLDRLNQLKPVKFNWIESGQEEEGFIAHEVDEIFSDAVVGEKDAVKDDGTVSPQTMDYGRITPLLVKAIQEQQTIIEDLKTRIETLEG